MLLKVSLTGKHVTPSIFQAVSLILQKPLCRSLKLGLTLSFQIIKTKPGILLRFAWILSKKAKTEPRCPDAKPGHAQASKPECPLHTLSAVEQAAVFSLGKHFTHLLLRMESSCNTSLLKDPLRRPLSTFIITQFRRHTFCPIIHLEHVNSLLSSRQLEKHLINKRHGFLTVLEWKGLVSVASLVSLFL